MMTTLTPLRAIIRGAATGIVGTAAMDLFLYGRSYREEGSMNLIEWEFGGPNDWDHVSTPGQLGKRLAEGFIQKPLPEKWARLTNTIMHWGYGISWGVVFGIVAGSSKRRRPWIGPLFGSAVWTSDYIMLPITGLYKPMWQYRPKELAPDFAAHLIYGTALSAAFATLCKLANGSTRN